MILLFNNLAALIELSKYKLSIISASITQLIENQMTLSKQEIQPPLFMLRVLAACMSGQQGQIENPRQLITLTFRLLNMTGTLADYDKPKTAERRMFIETHHASCRVLSYVSASDWPTYFGLFRSRLAYLTSTTEEYPELTDILMLECASLDSKRLGMVLTGNKKKRRGGGF
ncbi:unnamed protein product [Rhizopus stolonifer]